MSPSEAMLAVRSDLNRPTAVEAGTARSTATSVVRNRNSMTWLSLTVVALLSGSGGYALAAFSRNARPPVTAFFKPTTPVTPSTPSASPSPPPPTAAVRSVRDASIFKLTLRPLYPLPPAAPTDEGQHLWRDGAYETVRIILRTREPADNGTAMTLEAVGGIGGRSDVLPSLVPPPPPLAAATAVSSTTPRRRRDLSGPPPPTPAHRPPPPVMYPSTSNLTPLLEPNSLYTLKIRYSHIFCAFVSRDEAHPAAALSPPSVARVFHTALSYLDC